MLKRFGGWTDQLTIAAPPAQEAQEEKSDAQPEEASGDGDYLFVQESYIVTRGVLLDEEVVFDAVTPEWEEFCRRELQFAVPAELLEDVEDPATA
jgi:hypothetical protein